jgi:hypothetical protein
VFPATGSPQHLHLPPPPSQVTDSVTFSSEATR